MLIGLGTLETLLSMHEGRSALWERLFSRAYLSLCSSPFGLSGSCRRRVCFLRWDGMEVGVYLLRGVYTISPDELSFCEFQSRQFNRLFPGMPYLQPNQLQNIDKSLEFQFECFTPLIHIYLQQMECKCPFQQLPAIQFLSLIQFLWQLLAARWSCSDSWRGLRLISVTVEPVRYGSKSRIV